MLDLALDHHMPTIPTARKENKKMVFVCTLNVVVWSGCIANLLRPFLYI